MTVRTGFFAETHERKTDPVFPYPFRDSAGGRAAVVLAAGLLALAGLACDSDRSADGGSAGGSGGFGGSGGTGGDGGTAGSAGTGGPGECEVPEAECPPFQEEWASWGRPLEWHWWPRAHVGVADFEASGQFVGRALDELGNEILELRVPGTDWPLRLNVRTPPGFEFPFQLGETVTVRYKEFSHANYPFFMHLRILDAEGRLRWATENNSEIGSLAPFSPEIQTRAAYPSCSPGGTGALVGFDLEVSLRGGPVTLVRHAESSPIEGGGASGRLFWTGSALLCPPDGTPPDDSSVAALLVEQPGPEPTECRVDDDCDALHYCERGPGSCDDPGRCLPRPADCLEDSPLLRQYPCGCDGRVYPTACAAHAAGTDFSLSAPSTCPDVFRCGWFFCKSGAEACVVGLPSPSDNPLPPTCASAYGEAFPMREGCDYRAITCDCFDLTGTDCTCQDLTPVPGEVRIDCRSHDERERPSR